MPNVVIVSFAMERTPTKPLAPNPFTTYRDPQTGRWLVVVPQSDSEKRERAGRKSR